MESNVILTHFAPLNQVPAQYNVHAEKTPPVIAYVGGEHPHVTVTITYGTYGNFGNATSYRLHTPRGWVTVRWREDDGAEDGGPAPEMDGITHPDSILTLVIISPSLLPVYFRGAGGAKWVHWNGNRVPSVQAQSGSYHYSHPADPFRMDGGLNIVAVAYPDPE